MAAEPRSFSDVTSIPVTGGAGFIGSHTTAALVNGGHHVPLLDVGHPAAHSAPPPAEVRGVPVFRFTAEVELTAGMADLAHASLRG